VSSQEWHPASVYSRTFYGLRRQGRFLMRAPDPKSGRLRTQFLGNPVAWGDPPILWDTTHAARSSRWYAEDVDVVVVRLQIMGVVDE
jgi:hypothetical protein